MAFVINSPCTCPMRPNTWATTTRFVSASGEAPNGAERSNCWPVRPSSITATGAITNFSLYLPAISDSLPLRLIMRPALLLNTKGTSCWTIALLLKNATVPDEPHTTGHFLYAGTLFRQFLAFGPAGTAFQHTGFHPSEKMSSSVDEPFFAPAVLRATLQKYSKRVLSIRTIHETPFLPL